MESLDIAPPKNDGNEIPGMVVQTVTSIVGLPESMEVNVHPPVARDQRPTLQIGTPLRFSIVAFLNIRYSPHQRIAKDRIVVRCVFRRA